MNARRFVLLTASIALLGSTLCSDTRVWGQQPVLEPQSPPVRVDAIDRIRLFDSLDQPSTPRSSGSDAQQSKMSISELRQARALYRSNQRAARLEHNLWMGYEPLRPNWNAIPMMTSRYPNRQIYIPVYVQPR